LLAESDPTLGTRQVFVVEPCNDMPLDNKDSPLRLLVSDDLRPARWVRQLDSIEVAVIA